MVDIRNAKRADISTEREAVTVFQLVPKWSLMEETEVSYLEFVDEFGIPAGSQVESHYHDTVEFYRILDGRGLCK